MNINNTSIKIKGSSQSHLKLFDSEETSFISIKEFEYFLLNNNIYFEKGRLFSYCYLININLTVHHFY